jgi:hypothetical protein
LTRGLLSLQGFSPMADKANSLNRSRFIARYGPGRAGFGYLQNHPTAGKNDRLWCDVDGTLRPINHDQIITLTTTRTLLAKESGAKVILNSATAFTTTLPAAADGLSFYVFVKVAASATGHTVAVGTGPKMYGKVSPTGAAAAATASKGRTNTQATSVVGDALHVWSDGTDWYAIPTGTWAEQA